MFELSFGKLLILAFVVAVVWYGARGGSRPARRQSAPPNPPPKAGGAARRAEVEDMTPCPVCGTYVAAARPGACERPDCPYR